MVSLPFLGSPRTAGPQPRDVLRLALLIGSPRTAGPQPRDVLRLALLIGSPRTAGPQPRDVLRLALRVNILYAAALDFFGHRLGVAMAAPARHVRGERARAAAGGDDQEVIGLVHKRAHLGLVAGLNRSGHELGALEVRVAVLGVLPEELPDARLVPAVGG